MEYVPNTFTAYTKNFVHFHGDFLTQKEKEKRHGQEDPQDRERRKEERKRTQRT